MQRLFLAVFLLSLWACNQPQQVASGDEIAYADLEILENAEHFAVIGDWGRNGYFNQKELAVHLNNVVELMDANFIISTGDNFYDNGVASIDDPLWMSSFENIYDGPALLRDWYVVLGNHDYRGNAQAQIDYSHKSRRWNMPARYFHKHQKLKGSTGIDMVFMDSNPYQLEYHENPEKYRGITTQDTAKQAAWLDSLLKASAARWKIVIGHHPLFTSGKRAGKPQDMANRFKGLFDASQVDAYWCGHEHDLQHNKPEGYTHYYVSGAGSEVRPSGKVDFTQFAESVTGFMTFSFTPDTLLVQAIDYQGRIRYKYYQTK
ncbi:MAG: metallophosphoesterase [Bacteroidia bacterium]